MIENLNDHLILTFPVSTITTEISFSPMKNRHRSLIEDELLANCLIIYFEH